MIGAIVRVLLWTILAVVVSAAALFGYFIYTPDPESPHLTGAITEGRIESGGRTRSYVTYVPSGLPEGAPLVVAMHGSDGDAAQIRQASGYAFERLADERGFAIVYPEGFEGSWNGCNRVGDYAANTLDIDDVGFITALTGQLVAELHLNPARVYALGLSRGGHMAYRLALEAPERFRAFAAIAANMPADNNLKCTPVTGAPRSIMIVNGTQDPLNPFNGGEVRLFGLYDRGTVRSSEYSARYFAELDGITGDPEVGETVFANGVSVATTTWRSEVAEVQLFAVEGGGHVIPQPYWRSPRILGPTPREPNAPAEIIAFFERQAPRELPQE